MLHTTEINQHDPGFAHRASTVGDAYDLSGYTADIHSGVLLEKQEIAGRELTRQRGPTLSAFV